MAEEKQEEQTSTEASAEEAQTEEDTAAEEAEEDASSAEAQQEDATAEDADDEAEAEAQEAEASDDTTDEAEAPANGQQDEPQEASQQEAKKDKKSSKHEVTIEELLKAGAHFGHLTSRWHPRMEPYIFMKRNNIHIIDLMQTQVLLDEAADAARRFAKRGRTILFAGTKKQAQQIVRNHAESCDQPHMVNRWLGGTMTNFQTIRRSIRRMDKLEKMEKDGTFDKLKKKERLTRVREREKLEEVLGGIRTMADLPGALFIVDIKRENIAVSEARKLGIPIIAMVDTNCDPTIVDYPIPANDDALSSIELITSVISRSIQEGAAQREAEQKARKAEEEAKRQAQKENA